MEVIKLEPGTSAPVDSDCISIDTLPDGRFNLTGSLLDGDESTAIVGGPVFDTQAAAEAEGRAWAEGHGVAKLFVARDPARTPSD